MSSEGELSMGASEKGPKHEKIEQEWGWAQKQMLCIEASKLQAQKQLPLRIGSINTPLYGMDRPVAAYLHH